MTEEHQLIRNSVKEFAERYIAPVTRKMDLEDYYPRDLIRELGKQGFLTPSAPPEYGGPGIDLRGSVVVVEELSRYSPTLGFITEIVNDNIVYAYSSTVITGRRRRYCQRSPVVSGLHHTRSRSHAAAQTQLP